MVPVSVTSDKLLTLSAKFQPMQSPNLGLADVRVSCELIYSKIGHSFTLFLPIEVSKRLTRIRYFSPVSVVNGLEQTLIVEVSGVYEISCLYINSVNISDPSKTFFEPSVAPTFKKFTISVPIIGSFMSSPVDVLIFVGSCSLPIRIFADAASKLRVLPRSFPLIIDIFPTTMSYTATGVTVIGQHLHEVQSISLFASSPITLKSWNRVSVLSGAGNQTETLVLFEASAPGTVVLKVQIKDSELQKSFTLTHTPTIVTPNVLVTPFPFGSKLSLLSSVILPSIDFRRVRLLFNGSVSLSRCEYSDSNTALCTVPPQLPSGVVLLSLMLNSVVLLNDTKIKVLPSPEIISSVGGNREFIIVVNLWPCVSFPIISLNETKTLFILTEQKYGEDGFFSAAIQLPDVGVAGFQKLTVTGDLNGNRVLAETLVEFRSNDPSISLESRRYFFDNNSGQTERIICRNFARGFRNQDILVSFGSVFVASNVTFESKEEAFVMLDVVIPVQAPQIVTLSVVIGNDRASMMFEYRVPAITSGCYNANFTKPFDCSVPISGGSLYVQLNPAIEGIHLFSAFLQTTKMHVPLNSITSSNSNFATLEIHLPARYNSIHEGDLLCISALGMGTVLCFQYSYIVPSTPLSAYFDSFGSSISLTFASKTQMPVDCNLIFKYESLILLGGPGAVCIWTSPTVLKVIPTSSSLIVPGDVLNVLVKNPMADDLSPIVVQPPLQVATFNVELVGPGNVSACDVLEIDVVVSSSRSLMYYWSCIPPCPSDFEGMLRTITGPKFMAQASTLPRGIPLIVRVAVSTFLGAVAMSDPLYVFVHAAPLPSVFISASSKQILRKDFLELSAICSFASCSIDYEQISFAWSVETKAPISESVLEMIQNTTQSVLLLQPYALISGYTYKFSVSIKNEQRVNAADVVVTVVPGKLIPIIDGGSRTVSAHRPLVLDGSRSFDSDAQLSAVDDLKYCWTCQQVFGSILEPCTYSRGPHFGNSLLLPCLPVIKIGFQNITRTFSDRFIFKLILQSNDGRIASDFIFISASSNFDALLDVYLRINCDSNVCKESETIVLATNFSSSFSYRWTILDSPKFSASVNYDASNSVVRFRPMDLPPGNYEIGCVVFDGLFGSNSVSGQSSIKFQVVASPKGGRCDYSHSVANSPTFLVSCSRWSSFFAPLR
jgi:hypothetical protein